MALYELAVIGSPTPAQLAAVNSNLTKEANRFKLELGKDIALCVSPKTFQPPQRSAAAAVFFGGIDSHEMDVSAILDRNVVPILPVASTEKALKTEIPDSIRNLNCLFYDKAGDERVFSALLESIGLLPRQRRVFLSYRRSEATPAAVQLFAELSARKFEVFLDTHSIDDGVDFQENLWHQLCDVDVLIMLDTPGYFDSRWTAVEYGRALAKGIGVFRVQWPDSTPSVVTGTSSRVELVASELAANGTIADVAIQRICSQLEDFRSLSHATRHLGIVTAVENALVRIGGQLEGVGIHRTMQARLRSGRRLLLQPTIGVPTAVTLQQAIDRAGTSDSAVVYDHLGLMQSWRRHMDWLANSVKGARWVKVADAAWDLAEWEV